ncbi:hypothetical protein Tco_0199546 [Tanacetum coccineum]
MAKEEVPSKLPQRVLVNASLKSINSTFAPLRISVRKEQHLINVQKVTGELKHTQAVFDNVINSIQNFNNIFNVFDRDILNEIMEVQTVFNQMDVAVQQFSVDKQCLEIAKKELFLENDRLLQKIMSRDVLLTVMNSMSLIGESVNMDGKRKESCNLEVFKEQFDSIKKVRVRTKEQSDSLIEKLNLKSAKNEDLKAQLQDKVFVTTSLKNDLRKIKEKEIVDIAAQIPSTYTIVPVMFKLDLEPLAPRLSDITDIGLWIFRKHMIGNRSQLMNFVSKFLGTVRFGNDNIARIIGNQYGVSIKGNIRRIRACTHQRPQRKEDQYTYDEDIHDLRSVETKFPAIAFIDKVSSEKTHSCEPTVSSLNDEIDFRVSFDDFEDEDYTDSENDNEKVMPSPPSPEPTVSCFDNLYFFKDFENEFPAIVYNDAQTSKSYLLTQPILSPQHIDEFDLNDEISLFEYDKEEQNVLYFNDLFPFNIIHLDDLKSEKDNDDNEIDIVQSSGGNEIMQGPSVPALTKYHKGMKLNTPYPEDVNTPY